METTKKLEQIGEQEATKKTEKIDDSTPQAQEISEADAAKVSGGGPFRL
jgi:hypothetical protein